MLDVLAYHEDKKQGRVENSKTSEKIFTYKEFITNKYLALVTDSSSPGSTVATVNKESIINERPISCLKHLMIWCHISKDPSCADIISES